MENSKLILSTSLTLSSFGKTNLGMLIDEKGVVATIDSDEKISFSDWAFSRTFTGKNETVFFEGEFEESCTLLDVFNLSWSKTAKASAVLALSKIISFAIKNSISLPAVGFGGIYINFKDTTETNGEKSGTASKILFLPQEIFDRCTKNMKSEFYGELQGKSLRRGLDGFKALTFVRSCAIYKFFTGKDAFSEIDTEKRTLDMIDENFIPLEYEVFGIDRTLASFVNEGLRLKPRYLGNPGDRRAKNQKIASRIALEKETIENFPQSLLEKAVENEISENKPKTGGLDAFQFAKQRNNFIKKQKIIVASARFFKRNKNRILVSFAAILVAFYAGRSFYKTNQNLATTIGCTAEETAALMYSIVNNADAANIGEVISGKKMKNLEIIVTGFYTKFISRATMEEYGGKLTPAQFLVLDGKPDYWLFGITNLRIDGKNVDFENSYPTRKNHKEALSIENGGGEKDETKTFTATYYLIQSESDYRIDITEVKDEITVSWKKNRWLVTEINGKSKNSMAETKKFKSAYISSLENEIAAFEKEHNLEKGTGKSYQAIEKAIENLRKDYPWLPRISELKAAAEYCAKKYRYPGAIEYLEKNS